MTNRYRIFAILIVVLISEWMLGQTSNVVGVVFEDANMNGRKDSNEEVIEGVPVSSLSQIVLTDSNGEFELSVQERDIIFIIKPSEYTFPLQNSKIPDFYKLVYSIDSPSFLNYKGAGKTSLPDTLFFPLIPTPKKQEFKANMVADPQVPREREMQFFRETIIPSLYNSNSDFSVFLGDIADNNLDIYPSFISSLQALNRPVYAVFGNHDVNFRSPDNSLKAETYRSFFGPDYYSFNYGNTHFVVLNTVNYFGWNNLENVEGDYFGGIDDVQFNWLKQDLKLVDENSRVVLLTHIPLHTDFFEKKDIKKVFSLLEHYADVTLVSGHLHTVSTWNYDTAFWNGKSELRNLTAGSACGSWWSGPYASDSIPEAICVDGSPQGYFQYLFNEDSYSYNFIPVQKPNDFQFRVSLPHREVSFNQDGWQQVVVNVFAGDERSKVEFSINDGDFIPMEQFTGIDPFVVRSHYRRINGDNWSPKIRETSHLWEGFLPNDLGEGFHTIKVMVSLSDGNKFSSASYFLLTKK